jgi:hypothetical protein
MRCTVYNKKRRTTALAVFLIFLSGLFIISPHILEAFDVRVYGFIIRALGWIALSAAIYVVMRHIALSFVYAIVPRDAGGLDFTIARLRGERARVMECVLPMTDLVFADSGVTKRSLKKRFEGEMRFFDYSVTIGVEHLVLVFEDGKGYAALIIEPSDEMREYLTSYAKQKKIF